MWTELTVFIKEGKYVFYFFLFSFTLLHEAAELHLAVPFPILTGKVFIVPLQNIAFLTEIFNDGAMSKSSTCWGVAGVAPVLWLIWRLAYWPWEKRKTMLWDTQSKYRDNFVSIFSFKIDLWSSQRHHSQSSSIKPLYAPASSCCGLQTIQLYIMTPSADTESI